MRDIKFKGKKIDGTGWIFGHLVYNSWGPYIINHYSICDGVIESCIQAGVIPESVSEFTTLKDRFEKDIFEWDIIIFGNSTTKYTVKWCNDCWVAVSGDGDDYGPYTHRLYLNTGYMQDNKKISILGNIHDTL